MIEDIISAIQTLSQRLAIQEARPYNPYLSDAEMFDHFAGDGTIDARWTTTTTATGTVSLPATTPSLCRLSTGTSNSQAILNWGTRQPMVGMAKGADMRWRGAFSTAISANTVGVHGFRGPTAFTQLAMGVLGASSTAFFVCRSIDPGVPTSTTTITTVAIDTAQHDWRVQTMPDRVRYFIDNVQVAEHINGSPAAVILPTGQPLMPHLEMANGATAADQRFDVDLVWVRENR